MRRYVHLLTAIGVIAAGLLFIGWPSGSAQADLGSLAASSSTATVGTAITVTGSLSNVSGATVSMTSSSGVFSGATVSTGEAVSGIGTTALSFTGAGSTVGTVFVATYTCQVVGTTVFTLTQSPAGSGSSALTATVTCTSSTALTLSTTSAAVGQPVTVSGNCAAAGSLLYSSGGGYFTTATNGTVASGGQSVTCSATGTTVASYLCTTATTVTFTLDGQTASLVCGSGTSTYYPYGYYGGYGNSGYGYGTTSPVVTAVNPAVIAAVGISASPASVTCGQSAAIDVNVRDSAGNVAPDGTAVVLSSSFGSISPNTAITSGGHVSATFSAPSTDGVATITSAASGVNGTATVSVACGQLIAPSGPAVAYLPATTTSVSAIFPPNTGDAGLLTMLDANP